MISVKRLSIEDARILIEGAREKSVEIGLPMCIAVTDDSGNLIAFERMNGGKAHSVVVAQDKAFTAGAARKRRMSTMRRICLEIWLLESIQSMGAELALLAVDYL